MIPTAALPHTITVRPLTGTSGMGGPVFGPEFTVKARIVRKATQVRGPEGTVTLADTVAQIRPGKDIPIGSHVVHNSDTGEVAEIGHESNLSRPWVDNLILISPRQAQ